MIVLYTSISMLIMVLGWIIVGITRFTLGRARIGGFVLAAIGSSHVGLGYTIWSGKYDGVALLCTLTSFTIPYWMYVRERLAPNAN